MLGCLPESSVGTGILPLVFRGWQASHFLSGIQKLSVPESTCTPSTVGPGLVIFVPTVRRRWFRFVHVSTCPLAVTNYWGLSVITLYFIRVTNWYRHCLYTDFFGIGWIQDGIRAETKVLSSWNVIVPWAWNWNHPCVSVYSLIPTWESQVLRQSLIPVLHLIK